MGHDHNTKPPPGRRGAGTRCWFKITGMPGWKRKQLGLPAFSSLQCIPHNGQQAKSSHMPAESAPSRP